MSQQENQSGKYSISSREEFIKLNYNYYAFNDTLRYMLLVLRFRWWNLDLWNDFFDTFLNIQDCTSLPDLTQTRESFESFFYEKYRTRYQKVVFELGNELYRK